MIVTGASQLAGVIGWPVQHSRSPRLHGFWLERYRIDGAYLPLAVRPANLKAALAGLSAMGFEGCNLTIPHKEAALGLVDEMTPIATKIGAVNTVIVRKDGSLLGDNSDAFGFMENLRVGAPGCDFTDGPAVVLGAGGSSRAVCVALKEAGAVEIRLLNRTLERSENMAKAFGAIVQPLPWETRANALDKATLLVNTTSLGMDGQPPLDLDLSLLPLGAVVNDLVYSPLTTDLLTAAAGRGNITVDGLGMLLHQGRPGFKAWFGIAPEVTDDLRTFVASDLVS